MTKQEIIDKIEEISKIIESASMELDNLKRDIQNIDQSRFNPSGNNTLPLPEGDDILTGLTLDDLYKAFGKNKKSYAFRLKKALDTIRINTLEEFLMLTPGDLLSLENVGYKTLTLTQKSLKKMGIEW